MDEELTHLVRDAAAGFPEAQQVILEFFRLNKIDADDCAAILAYLKNATRNTHYATYFMALLYEQGIAVPKDLEMTFLCMREAAAKGNACAIYEVGRRFLEGIGIEKNYANAHQWLMLAAESPYYIPHAMDLLANMYEQGLGVDVDTIKAAELREQAKTYKTNYKL